MAATSKILGWLLTVGVMAISIAVNGGVAFVAYGPVFAGFMVLFTLVLDGTRVAFAQVFPRHKTLAGGAYLLTMALAWAMFDFSFRFAITNQSKPSDELTELQRQIDEVAKKVVPNHRTPEAIRASAYCTKYPDKNNCSGVVYNNKEKKDRLADLDAELVKVEESLRNEAKLTELRNLYQNVSERFRKRSEHLFVLNVPDDPNVRTLLPFVISMVVELGIIAGACLIAGGEFRHVRRPTLERLPRPNADAREHSADAETFATWLHNSWLDARGEDGLAWYTQRGMAQEAGVSSAGRVNQILKLMVADGRIEVRTRVGRGAKTGVRFKAQLRVVPK